VTSRGRKPQPRRRDDNNAQRLLAAIAEDPSDDHARQVYADLLIERGDPRGTFISMQLARERRNHKAEFALLKKHARHWIRPLAGLVERDVGIGFDHFDRRTRFERGFLACCTIGTTAPRLMALADKPILSTVEHLGVPRNSPHKKLLDSFETFLQRAPLPALRSLEVTAPMVALVLADPIAKRLDALGITGSSPAAFAAAARSRLSGLRTLWFKLDGGTVADEETYEAVERALERPTLERLEVEVYQAHASYRRVEGRWTVEMSEIRGQLMAKRLEQLAG
jgi:uncharacterized protein (TIGR02996 family)